MNSLPEPVQMALCFVVMPLMFLQGFSFMAGTAILAAMLWFAGRKSIAIHAAALMPLAVPVLSALWLAAQALTFLTLARGTSIRPMGWALFVGMSSIALMILSIVNTVLQFKKGNNKIICSIALVLSLLVIAVPSVALHAVAQIRGLVLVP